GVAGEPLLGRDAGADRQEGDQADVSAGVGDSSPASDLNSISTTASRNCSYPRSWIALVRSRAAQARNDCIRTSSRARSQFDARPVRSRRILSAKITRSGPWTVPSFISTVIKFLRILTFL